MNYTKFHIDDSFIIHHAKLSTKAKALFVLFLILLTPGFLFAQTCPDGNHPHMIDLGLPSGTKWACCNVGATKPEEYGGYYAWGETEEKDTYNWSNYSHCDYGQYNLCHYLGNISGTDYDVAHVKWSDNWKMPSYEHMTELRDYCTNEWTTFNDINGLKFTGPNGNSIFLPAAGYKEQRHNGTGAIVSYWSSKQHSELWYEAYYLLFELNHETFEYNRLLLGQSVRPVWYDTYQDWESGFLCPDNNHPHIIDLGLPSGTKWACCNVGASKPVDSGGHFAWGETDVKWRYDWDSYHYGSDSYSCQNLGNDIAGTKYDVAHVKWGGRWNMPSLEQIQELLDNCRLIECSVNDIKGRKFISPNGVIFLPYAGYRSAYDPYNNITSQGSNGLYWSSNPSSVMGKAYYLSSGYEPKWDSESRFYGYSVRPVYMASENIIFSDLEVKHICVENWDTDGDGELCVEEAVAVTKINQEFYNNREITSFDELKYFVNVTEIAENAFYDCRALTSITFPQSLTTIGDRAFFNCYALKEVHIPVSVSSIGSAVFSCCTILSRIVVDPQNAYYDSRNDCNAIIEKATGQLIAGCNNSVIPEGVTAIGTEAFRGMYDLEGITLPNTLTSIGSRAFYYCRKLTGHLAIPEGVTEVGGYAFYKCTELTSIELPSTLEEITYRMFDGCDNVTTMKVNWRTPLSVPPNFFSNYNNCVLKVPEGCVEVYKSTDVWKDFKEIVDDGQNITFADQTVKNICLDHWDTNGDGELSVGEAAAVTQIGSVFQASDITSFDELQYFTGLTSIENEAFMACEGLTSIVIPNHVTRIGEHAFSSCISLISITIPNSVSSIGSWAFCETGISSITIPKSVISIEGALFGNSEHLTSVTVDPDNPIYDSRDNCNAIIETSSNKLIAGCQNTIIPNSVTNIGKSAFACCYKLKSIEIPNSVTIIEDLAFEECPNLYSFIVRWEQPLAVPQNLFFDTPLNQVTLFVPSGTVFAYRKADVWKDFGNILEIGTPDPRSIITFADEKVKTICVSKWDSNGDGELSVSEASAVTKINTEFYNNREITSFDELKFFTNLTEIAENAFYDCRALTSITFPQSLTTIDDRAFFNCYALKEVHIPVSVSSIGSAVFSCCTILSRIVVDPQNAYYDSRNDCNAIIEKATGQLIAGCNNSVIPEGVTAIGIEAFRGMYDLEGITLPNTLTSIGSRAFYYCRKLTGHLAIPEGVTEVGGYAFYKCTELTSIELPSTLEEITYRMLDGCDNVTIMKVNWRTPLSVSPNFFSNYNNCVLKVPEGSVVDYKSADVWKDFKEIHSDATYTLSIQSSTGGTISYNNNNIKNDTQSFSVEEGDTVILNIIPDTEYVLSRLTFNGADVTAAVTNGQFIITNITVDNTIVAQFTKKSYTLTIQSTGNGKVTYNGYDIDNTTQSFSVEHGVMLTLTLSANNNHQLSSLSVNGKDVSSEIIDSKYTINEVTSNMSVVAVFEPIPVTTFMLSIQSSSGGTVSYNGIDVSDGEQTFNVSEGSNVTIGITPSTGFELTSLLINGNEVKTAILDGKYTINEFSGSTTIKATFSKRVFSLSIEAEGNGTVSFKSDNINNSTQSFNVEYGTTATITITPNDGYQTASVILNGNNVTANVINGIYTIPEFSSDNTLKVSFEAIPVTTYNLVIQSSMGGGVSYNGATVSNATRVFSVSKGATVSLGIISDTGFELERLIVNDNDMTHEVNGSNFTVENISQNTTIEAQFKKKTFSLSVSSTGNGQVVYGSSVIRNEAITFSVEYDNSASIVIMPDNGYQLAQLILNGNDMTAAVTNNVYTIANITSVQTVNIVFEQIPAKTYTLKLDVGNGGTVEFNGAEVSNTSRDFIVNEGASTTLTFTPNEGYSLKSLLINNKDMTVSIVGNTYVINNINEDITVIVEFKAIPTIVEFTIDNIKYVNISSKTHEVEVKTLVDNYSEHLEIPATVHYEETTWNVTQIAANAFSGNAQLVTISIPQTVKVCGNNIFGGCKRLCAIIWLPQHSLTKNQTGDIENSNLLFYTDSRDWAPDGIGNVVVNNHASQIILKENNEFYCPQTFITDKISFTHHYTMETGIGESKGWETLVLPFDVKKMTHDVKGDIVPFATYTADYGTHPFWLYGYDSVRGFVEKNSIEANRPYVISMPNNSRYADEYILTGYVTFSSENAYVISTNDLQPVICGDNVLWPSFSTTTKNVKALNVNNDYVSYHGGINPGSAFIYGLREARPFEAYMTSASGSNVSVTIFDDLPTGIGVIPEKGQQNGQINVYSTSGQIMKTCNILTPIEKVLSGLPPGIYIVNGHKMVVK